MKEELSKGKPDYHSSFLSFALTLKDSKNRYVKWIEGMGINAKFKTAEIDHVKARAFDELVKYLNEDTILDIMNQLSKEK